MLLGEAWPSCYRQGSAAHSDPHTVLVFLPVPECSLWVNIQSDGLYIPEAQRSPSQIILWKIGMWSASFPIDFPCQKLSFRVRSDFKSLPFMKYLYMYKFKWKRKHKTEPEAGIVSLYLCGAGLCRWGVREENQCWIHLWVLFFFLWQTDGFISGEINRWSY